MPFNATQQMAYFSVLFILAPLVMFTGLFQSPAIANHFSTVTRALGGRQVIRSIHFFCLSGYVFFIISHVSMVLLHGWGYETSKMIFGNTDNPMAGGIIFGLLLVLLLLIHIAATKWTLKKGRQVEKLHNRVVRPWSNLLYKLPSRMHYDKTNITKKDVGMANVNPNHRASGRPPATDEYLAIHANCYQDDYVLEIGGYVEKPMTLTIADLRELANGYSHTPLHHCVQGFTSIGKWRGIPVSALLDLVKPLPDATDVVYTSFQSMGRDDPLYKGGLYYESNPMV